MTSHKSRTYPIHATDIHVGKAILWRRISCLLHFSLAGFGLHFLLCSLTSFPAFESQNNARTRMPYQRIAGKKQIRNYCTPDVKGSLTTYRPALHNNAWSGLSRRTRDGGGPLLTLIFLVQIRQLVSFFCKKKTEIETFMTSSPPWTRWSAGPIWAMPTRAESRTGSNSNF